MERASWANNIIRVVGIAMLLLAGAASAEAQQPAKVWKIGVLVSSTQALNALREEALRQGLRDLGYQEGKNIVMEDRGAAQNATPAIPFVVAGAGDLVEAGLIKSFMFPGGNVTGVARMSADFFGARLKLIKETLPKATQVTALANPKNPGHGRSIKDAELGARSLGLNFQTVNAQSANELDGAITNAAKGGANALFLMTDTLFNNQIARIAQAALKNKLPAVYDRADFVEAGGLMSYGVNLPDLSRRAAEYIDQIFKGAKPGELTLVQPTKFDLSVNLKTAGQIGVTIPPEVLNRAVKG